MTLRTRRLDLAPVGRDDVNALWTIRREPAVRLYLFDDVPVTRECGNDRAVGVVGLRRADATHRVIRRLGFTPTGEHQGPVYRARTYALTARDDATTRRD